MGRRRGRGRLHVPVEQARLDRQQEGGEKCDDHDTARERGDAEGLRYVFDSVVSRARACV